MGMRTTWLLLLVIAFTSRPARCEEQDLCEGQDWFSQAKPNSSLLCKGVFEAAFNRTSKATADLARVLREHAEGPEGYRAREVLLQMSFRQGRYRDALTQADLMLAMRPEAKDISGLRPLLEVLSQSPTMKIERRRSVLPYVPTLDPNPHFKVRAEGKDGLFYADTGANISVMSDAEARRLGLTIKSVETKMGDVSGSMMSIQVAEVKVLRIGRCVLRDVVFTILPASQPPFNEVPVEQQGLLGIQVLLALGRIHVEENGGMEIAGKDKAEGHRTPLVFYQSQPVVQMSFNGRQMLYTMDTGAVHTTLNPLFGSTFPAVLRDGSAEDHPLTGFGGTSNQPSTRLDHLQFTLASVPVTLAPAVVLTKQTTAESAWAAGNLGYDLLKQTAPFTIDFGRMSFRTTR